MILLTYEQTQHPDIIRHLQSYPVDVHVVRSDSQMYYYLMSKPYIIVVTEITEEWNRMQRAGYVRRDYTITDRTTYPPTIPIEREDVLNAWNRWSDYGQPPVKEETFPVPAGEFREIPPI